MEDVAPRTGASEVIHDVSVAKVSAIGVGMRNHSGVAARAFSALTQESINILMISTSEIKITILIQEKYVELAVRTTPSALIGILTDASVPPWPL